MKNNKKSIIMLSACAMVVGLLLGAIGFFSGGARSVTVNQSGVHIINNSLHTLKNLNLNAFQSIDLDAQNANIEFIQSEHYGIEICYYNDTFQPSYTVGNGTLKASDGAKNTFFNLDFCTFHNSNVIKIYLPANVTLKDATIKGLSGTLNVGSFSAQTTNINLLSGNMTILGVTSDTFTADVGDGNITMKDSSCKSLSVSDTSGNITLENLTTSQLSGIVKHGNTTIHNSKLGNVNLDTLSGRILATDITTTQLTANCKSGNMNFSGTFGGKTDLQSIFGNVDFSTSIAEDQYGYGLSVLSGNIKVNGSRDAQHVKQNNGAANDLTVSNKSGNINVNFQK